MSKYILKRLAMMIPVILGMSFFIFVILEMAPGDPAKSYWVTRPPWKP